MRRRSPNSKLAVMIIVVAVILASQLIRLGQTQPRTDLQQSKSATAEFNELFVSGLRNPAVTKSADNIRTTAPNRFVADSAGARPARDPRSGRGPRMQTNSLPDKAPTQIKDSTGLVRLLGEVPAALS